MEQLRAPVDVLTDEQHLMRLHRIAMFRKIDGAWKMVGNVSNFKPAQDQARRLFGERCRTIEPE
jgi:hypothetical protein